VPEYFCSLSVDGSSLCMATVNFNFLRGLWEICSHPLIYYNLVHSTTESC